MALVICPDCGKKVSSRAPQCPFCGCPSQYFVTDESQITDDKTENNSESNVKYKHDSEVNKRYNDKSDSKIEENSDVIYSADLMKSRDDILKDISSLGYMPRFKFGKEAVTFSPETFKYLPVVNKMQDAATQQIDFLNDIGPALSEGLNANSVTLGGYVSLLISAGQAIIDNCLDVGVSILVQENINNYSVDKIKDEYSDEDNNFNVEHLPTMQKILNQVGDINEEEFALANRKYIDRNSRNRWVGGGLGIEGAIKGAIDAGILNMASDIFYSVGDHISDSNCCRPHPLSMN